MYLSFDGVFALVNNTYMVSRIKISRILVQLNLEPMLFIVTNKSATCFN